MRWRLRLAAVLLGGALYVVVAQVRNPRRIPWEPAPLPGCKAEKAEGLVLQQEEPGGTVWATRGYDVYRSRDGGSFERVASVTPPLGEPWGGYFRSLRKYFGYQELVEVLPLGPTTLLAFAGGAVFRIDLETGTQQRVQTLRYFGRGKGRGVMSRIAVDDRGSIYYGEYSTANERHAIRVWRGTNEGRDWSVAHEFEPGEVFHVHGLEWDPVHHELWVMTGDADAEVHLGYSTDQGQHFTWIGQGSQPFRACSLIFEPDAVLWATDADDHNGLMQWSRRTGQVTRRADLPAQSLYAQQIGPDAALIGESSWDASLYEWNAGQFRPIARFTPTAAPGQPFSGVRLARGPAAGGVLYFNVLRTAEEEAAIYRLREAASVACRPAPEP